MAAALHELSYEQWIKFVFERPMTDVDWYHSPRVPQWPQHEEPLRRIEYLTRLFRHPHDIRGRLSVDQLGLGFWFLINHAAGDYLRVLCELELPWPERKGLIEALGPLFRFFSQICDEDPIERTRHGYWAKHACQMFWDVCAVWPEAANAEQRESDAACLDVMKQTLGIDHSVTRAATLRGLGKWSRAYPAEVGAIVDQFLQVNLGLSEELQRYAMNAKKGVVV